MQTSENTHAKKNPTLERWVFIVIYAFVGALLAIPVALLITATLDAALADTETQFPHLATALRCLATIAGLSIAFRQAGFQWSHFDKLWCWPPVTVAVPLGLWMLLTGLVLAEPEKWQAAGGWQIQNWIFGSSIVTSAAVLARWAWAKLKRAPALGASADKSLPLRIGSLEDLEKLPIADLLSWLENESPVTRERDDLFGAKLRADRIFTALQQKRPNPEEKKLYKTAVIQGPFGSGKSTMVAFIKQAAQAFKRPQYIFAHVNCWGFSSTAAQEHILDQAISELSEHVDCLSLHHLPSAYSNAISDSSSWLGALAGVFGSPSSPVDVLRQLTPILHAIKAHLVIIIEDTDRNSSDFDQKQIEAMLHSFREVERVSFVLTAGTQSQIDFPKVAEHIQFVPRLPTGAVMTLMDRVRQHCRTHWTFIDPVSGRNRPERLVNSDGDGAEIHPTYGMPEWIGVTASLLDNPRNLKQVLSGIVDAWGRLHGEVDVDELIMLTVLRHAAPAVFDFLGTHRASFKSIAPSYDSKEDAKDHPKQERLAYLKQRWHQAAAQSGHNAHTLGRLIGELVYDSTHVTGCAGSGNNQRCQSVGSLRGEVYWERATAGSVLESDVRDQEVLSIIQKTQATGDVCQLADKMATSAEFGNLVLRFQKWSQPLGKKAVLDAASAAFRKVRPLKFGIQGQIPRRYQRIVDLVNERFKINELPVEWWIAEMIACLPYDLRLADELYDDFRQRFTSNEIFGKVRAAFVAELKPAMEALTPDEFAGCFQPDYPWLLGHLVKLDGSAFPSLFLAGWEHWTWMAPHLLTALENHPEVILPQIICAFGQSNAQGGLPTAYHFDETSLRLVFGKHAEEVLKRLATPVPFADAVHQWMPGSVNLAAKQAQWLLQEGWTPVKP